MNRFNLRPIHPIYLTIPCLVFLIVFPAMLSKPIPRCQQTQSGQVQVFLDENTGAGITAINYDPRCPFTEPPILVVSPTGQGSFWAARFEANSLTGEFGSVAVIGQPGETVNINWIATAATQPGPGSEK